MCAARESNVNVENVVATSSFGTELDLATLATDIEGAEYDPERFSGLLYRCERLRHVVLLFRSGKVVYTGGDSVDTIRQAHEMFVEKMHDIGVSETDVSDLVIQNIVSTADIGERLNLNAIAIGLGLERVEYEPEQFPGLVYRIEDPDVVGLIFGSGKVVLTGAQERDSVEDSFEVIQNALDELGLVG